MAQLYNDRDILKKRLNATGNDNTEEIKKIRVEISGSIAVITARLDILYLAKKEYLSSGNAPREEDLYPKEKEPNSADLMKMRNNLRSYITRDRNLLDYQSEKKPEKGKPKPMPQCPRRTQIEERLANREKKLKSIESEIERLNGKSGGN